MNYPYIHATLRSALVDRDHDSMLVQDNAAVINVNGVGFALKPSLPSGALLVAYTMLFHSNFAEVAEMYTDKWFPAAMWLGGEQNPHFPLFLNEQMAGIALAVACRAGLIQAYQHPNGLLVRPDFTTRMVQRTTHEIKLNKLTIADAKELFIALMQDDEYRLSVDLADDYIANPFIAEFEVSIAMTDFTAHAEASKEFGDPQ